MKYNCTISNMGALPIAYALQCGEAVSVEQLFKDRPLHREVAFISGTGQRQIVIDCKTHKVILDPSPDLNILFHEDKVNGK